MTAEQKERAKRIWEERNSLECRSTTINLLLDFWQEANICYKKKINHIVGIMWELNQESGEWKKSIIDAKRSKTDSLDTCLQGEEKL